jgi:hypothetical protein
MENEKKQKVLKLQDLKNKAFELALEISEFKDLDNADSAYNGLVDSTSRIQDMIIRLMKNISKNEDNFENEKNE